MLASDYFGMERSDEDDWFDTLLEVDTKLFVDPFLVFKETEGFWANSHDDLIAHFNRAFVLIAEGNLNPQSLAYKKALGLLDFKEPRELCLGYTERGTGGSGSSGKLAVLMAGAIEAAIQRGLKSLAHFEEVGILQERIGSDRISDATCTILKPKLIEYTRSIAERHSLDTADHRLHAAEFDEYRQRFRKVGVNVPTNPNKGKPLLFVPERFLSALPQLNADAWWENFENERLRIDLNYEVMGKVKKSEIVARAREHVDSVETWAAKQEEQNASPYDMDRDPEGVILWQGAAKEFTSQNPLAIAPPQSGEEFEACVALIIEKFRLFIEEQRGWWLLWDQALGKDKPEVAPQLVFYGIARSYCEANNIVVDPETDLGRGPVDFKFSNGFVRQVHMEVKKLHNGRFWNGLDRQLPAYMSSDEATKGWFLAIRYRDGDKWDDRARELPGRVRDAASQHKRDLRAILVDARPKVSASKL